MGATEMAAEAAVELALALADPGARLIVGEPIMLEATYTARRPVILFHRIILGWAPDELELLIEGSGGTQVSRRVLLSVPKTLPLQEKDFVRLEPGKPLSFRFPLWSDKPLAPGSYKVRARYMGGPDHYADAQGVTHRIAVFSEPIESNPVALSVVPK
ncbi:MAG: hypothetical protein JXB05_21350 [Myxococcaceae bacterium]|nr:hypothetical protein [Myxococcaceae bacterium]